MAKNIKKRNWAFVLYPESAPADWREQLKKLDCNVQSAHYINKDMNQTIHQRSHTIMSY